MNTPYLPGEFRPDDSSEVAEGAFAMMEAASEGSGVRVDAQIDVLGTAGVSEEAFAKYAKAALGPLMKNSGFMPPDIFLD